VRICEQKGKYITRFRSNMYKYIIWGSGHRGRAILNLLSNERVICFIDENPNKQNTYVNGIKIISKEMYLLGYSKYPIIVAVKGHQQDVIEEKQNKGIYWIYDYDNEFFELIPICKQVSIEKLTSAYKKGQRLDIWGHGAFSRLLYDLLKENGFDVRVIIDETENGLIYDQMEKEFGISLTTMECCIKEKTIILKAQDMTDDVKKYFGNNDIQDYLDLQCNLEWYRNPAIEKFKNIHSNKRCFIIGTGPSLKMSDLDVLHENNEICFAVNSIFPAFNKTKWRPTYYVASDDIAIFKNEILELRDSACFISDYGWCFDENDDTTNIYKWHAIMQNSNGQLSKFSDDFSKGGYCAGTVVYDGGMQLAVYMGIKEIYLLGVDCYYSKDLKYNHFGKNEDPDDIYSDTDNMFLAYKSAKIYADTHGIKIFNATRGGALEVFPRVDFDSLFML
jgi:hypothetical protein